MTTPIVAAIDMGYGHLRPASALAAQLGTEVLHMELPPLGAEVDRRFWEWTREVYEPLTRFSQLPGLGPPMTWKRRVKVPPSKSISSIVSMPPRVSLAWMAACQGRGDDGC